MGSLGLQTDGTYLLERHEEQASCDALYKNIWGRIQLIKGLPAKAKAEQAAPAAHGLAAVRALVRRRPTRV